MDLFTSKSNHISLHKPLAERMRPQSLENFIGQEHLLGTGKLLRKIIENDLVHSMILQGPPATGKTTIASIICAHTSAEFVKLNAVSLTIAELRSTINQAKDNLKFYAKKTILFIDEIHAMKSNVQMSLLETIENGTFILIGATTESVTHDIIPPLLSRCKVYTLTPLKPIEIEKIIKTALNDCERGLGKKHLTISQEALAYIADISNGDIRAALNTLEVVASSKNASECIDLETTQQASELRLNGITTTDFYDLTSAFIKSLRGSQTDAALYWLARMLNSGVDPVYIARRIVVHATEDVGLANPQALQVAIAAKDAVEFLGMPESRLPLAQAVIYIAESPKSNSAYKAITNALNLVKSSPPYPVPKDIKNSSGTYINPIDNPNKQINCLPPNLKNTNFYTPQNSGIETKIYNKYFPK